MLYHLSLVCLEYWKICNVVQYVSFRAGCALLTAFCLFLMFGRSFIEVSQAHFRSLARESTPESHKLKDDTPTMGGVFIIGVVTVTTLLWNNLTDSKIWTLLLTLYTFGLIGAWDDWAKICYKKGVSVRKKFLVQAVVAVLVLSFWYLSSSPSTFLIMPFLKNYTFDMGFFFLVWAVWVVLCTVNAVNFTDGLDGLAATTLTFNFMTFGIIAYLVGTIFFASYLYLPYAQTAEIAVLCGSLVGALLGFLWYNTYPAQIFMGDVGSLALGAVFAMIALMTKQELLIPIAGGLFVVEGVSVALQILCFKLFGRRIFKMAPLHHHFELLGWPESKITVRFAIVTFLLCLLALVTLKLR